MHNWCLLTSGYGRSAQTILNLFKKDELGHSNIALVIYDQEPSAAFELASKLGIPTKQIRKSDFSDRASFENALTESCKTHMVDNIFLLGFGYVLKYSLLETYQGRIVNVHPSLLPSFKGKKAIQQAIDYGVKVTGITTHYIDEKLDEGSIIYQEPILINSDMSFEEIDALFMKAAPKTLKTTIDIVASIK